MEISNALPVQFWLVGCDTYNEHEAAGVHHKCYCAPWQCDDEIKVQFKDVSGNTYSLLIYDDNEQLLESIDIDEISSGVYQKSFIPSETSPDFCDRLIQIKIQQNAGFEGFSLPSLDEWLQTSGLGADWTLGATPSIGVGLFFTTSELLYVDYAFVPGIEYSIIINFNIGTGSGVAVAGRVSVRNSSGVLQFSQVSTISLGPSTSSSTDPLTFIATTSTTRVSFSIESGFGGSTFTITSTTAARAVGEHQLIAKSDCLDIRQEHQDSILLTYSNHRNFAGLVYEDFSPANEFQIRIPATFFHQRFPEEDETMELSTSLVTLNGTVRKQRLLDTDYVPYYFHEKLKLILKHQILEIFNRQWVKQEGYEIVEGDRRWPMKKAKCWLSEKDFVHRNIL